MAKYSSGAEAEVRSWFQSLLNEKLEPGMRQLEDQLRNGQLLCRSTANFHSSQIVRITVLDSPKVR